MRRQGLFANVFVALCLAIAIFLAVPETGMPFWLTTRIGHVPVLRFRVANVSLTVQFDHDAGARLFGRAPGQVELVRATNP